METSTALLVETPSRKKAGAEMLTRVLEWCTKQVRNESDPSMLDLMVHMGMDAEKTKKFLLDHVKEVAENNEGNHQEGDLACAVHLCHDVLQEVDNDTAHQMLRASLRRGPAGSWQRGHSENDFLALARALPKGSLDIRFFWTAFMSETFSVGSVQQLLSIAPPGPSEPPFMLLNRNVRLGEIQLAKSRLILPMVSSISVAVEKWPASSLVKFLRALLVGNTSVSSLAIHLPREVTRSIENEESENVSQRDILRALNSEIPIDSANSDIEVLQVNCFTTTGDVNPYMNLIDFWTERLHFLKKLHFSGHFCLRDMSILATVLRGVKGTLESLLVRNCSREDEAASGPDCILDVLEDDTLGPFALREFYFMRSALLENPLSLSQTLKVVNILEKNKVLEYVAIGPFRLFGSPTKDINEKVHNFLFYPSKTCYVDENGEKFSLAHLIRTYLALNRCNRANMEREGATLEDLGTALVKAINDDWVYGKDVKDERQNLSDQTIQHRKHSMFFTILLSNPTSWCNSDLKDTNLAA